MHFREALNLENVSLPRSFVNALQDGKEKNFDLERFVAAQDGDYGSYNEALEEIKSGRKTRHWIWYIFPQIKGLGFSCNSEYYGLSGIEEAQAYLNHPMLGMRLREISQALLNIDGHSAHEILGSPDDMKVQSCMTLFDIVSPNDIFKQVLDRYYMGEKCPKTVMRIERRQTRPMLRKLTISKDYRVLLGDKEIRMEPLLKAIYLLYLKHPEGIVFKSLPDYRGELTEIYNHLKPRGMNAQVLQSIEDVTNPLLNSINEKCSRIKAIFMDKMDEILANNYIILGKSGKTKKILLNRNLVVWE
ncbi:MAG: DUF1810 domain-containing protein [Bacteroidaceae bacterium]|nr:DUF1810 domain-containing protein [Bacteroidaceae bacterium]